MKETELHNFRNAMLQALQEEQDAGQIGPLRAMAIRRAANNPRRLEDLRDKMAAEYHADNGPGNAAPDWANLADFIKQLLPLIAQLVALFKV